MTNPRGQAAIDANRKRAAKHPREHIICKTCGKEFDDYPSHHRVYCSQKCAKIGLRTVPDCILAQHQFNGEWKRLPHPECYLKEARAMLEGKNTRGKNKCCKLPGD